MGGSGLYTRISIIRIKDHSSANDFCSKRGRQAWAGEPREGEWADSGYQAPTSWILQPLSEPLSRAHLRSPLLCSSLPLGQGGNQDETRHLSLRRGEEAHTGSAPGRCLVLWREGHVCPLLGE